MSLLHGVGDFFAMDIGTNALRLVQLTGDAQHGFALMKYAYVPVDPKMVQDNSAAGKTFTAIIEVPNAPKKQLENTIKYEVDKYIPMSVDEAEFDYTILGVSPNDPAKAEVLLSSTSKDYAENMMELIEGLGLNVIAQEPEPLAMARALLPVGSKEARMMIDLGERSTDIVVMYEGVPRLVRSVPGGLSKLVKTVAQTLSVREDQARRFILKFGLSQDKLEGQVFRAMEQDLENFAQELTNSVRFFQTKYANVPVIGIVLSGFAGVIPFIAEYMEAKTGIQTVQGNPWQLVQVTPEQQQALMDVASEFSVAIGLAERSNDGEQ